ncbi:MAG TPA: thioredoxin domain-containing protein [Anaerolineae bacterium]|jgi:protein-disulfide isomerase
MSKRRELVEQRHAQERKQTLIILGAIAVIAVVLIGGAIVLSNKNSASTAINSLAADPRPTPTGAQANDRAWGPVDAPIKVEEYLDYQCPACGSYNRNYEAGMIDAYAKTGKVRYEVHSMSFIGQESIDAAQAALCASDQNKFWQMHNSIFSNQSGENQGAFAKDRLKSLAVAVGLDATTFNTCLDSGKYADKVTQERNDGDQRGVNQTPTFFVNNKMYVGTQSAADFKRIFAEVAPNVNLGN